TDRIENIPDGWRARETHKIVNQDEYTEVFELALAENMSAYFATCSADLLDRLAFAEVLTRVQNAGHALRDRAPRSTKRVCRQSLRPVRCECRSSSPLMLSLI